MPTKSQIQKSLLDIKYITSITPNVKDLKVALKKDPIKGTGLFASKDIKKGNIIAYYKMKVYDLDKNTGPFKDMYKFTIYTKTGRESNRFIGNLYEGSVHDPIRNIPFWAYFSNEPSGKQSANALIDSNLKSNYKDRTRVKEGDVMIYKLIAVKNIKAGEEIVWCYGDAYQREYETSCDD